VGRNGPLDELAQQVAADLAVDVVEGNHGSAGKDWRFSVSSSVLAAATPMP
jgi:hypothetical protein